MLDVKTGAVYWLSFKELNPICKLYNIKKEMKKLLGILFCFGFLLFAGTTETQAQTEPINSELQKEMYVDISNYSLDTPVITISQSKESKLIDVGKLRAASRQAAINTNYALRNEIQFILDCPVIHINKRTYSLGYRYSHYSNKHLPKAIWLPYFSI